MRITIDVEKIKHLNSDGVFKSNKKYEVIELSEPEGQYGNPSNPVIVDKSILYKVIDEEKKEIFVNKTFIKYIES